MPPCPLVRSCRDVDRCAGNDLETSLLCVGNGAAMKHEINRERLISSMGIWNWTDLLFFLYTHCHCVSHQCRCCCHRWTIISISNPLRNITTIHVFCVLVSHWACYPWEFDIFYLYRLKCHWFKVSFSRITWQRWHQVTFLNIRKKHKYKWTQQSDYMT